MSDYSIREQVCYTGLQGVNNTCSAEHQEQKETISLFRYFCIGNYCQPNLRLQSEENLCVKIRDCILQRTRPTWLTWAGSFVDREDWKKVATDLDNPSASSPPLLLLVYCHLASRDGAKNIGIRSK